MDDALFQKRADAALEDLFDALTAAGDDHDLEADFNAGALTVEFENPPAKFVVSPNSPVHQIWISANVKSYKLSWDDAAQAFTLDGLTLRDHMAAAVSTHLGETVRL
ncbi:MAG: iron donor protein CyaY [Bryobacteraceae bacterium]